MLATLLIWFAPVKATPVKQHIQKQAREVFTSPAVKVKKPKAVVKAPRPEKKTAVATVAKAETPQPVTKPSYPPTHQELMAQAGINPKDYGAVEYIIAHESGWNVNATEPTSGAHGLPQALPYSKTGCGWSDGVCQLKWANQYAVSRYGGWWEAYAHWTTYNWW